MNGPSILQRIDKAIYKSDQGLGFGYLKLIAGLISLQGLYGRVSFQGFIGDPLGCLNKDEVAVLHSDHYTHV